MTVLLLTDAAMDAHQAAGHPERPERRDAAASGVRDAAGDLLIEEAPSPATENEALAVHDPAYLRLLREGEAGGGGWLDADTYLVPGSMRAAELAAGATVQAARAATTGAAEVAFAVVRPPGHHATRAGGSGFCLLNNVAIAAAALRAAGVQRVAIVDWDVHHGDGTQSIFDADPDLWFGSTHQAPFYPGTGDPGERGRGAAVGTKLNRPLAAGEGDDVFVETWRDDLLPALEGFAPRAILVSAGFDAHRDDPLAGLEVTEAGYEAVAEGLGGVAARLGVPGIALTLEGGYALEALRASAAATVRGLRAGRAGAVDPR